MSTQVCRDYLSGSCRFGNSCRYYHPPRSGQGGRNVSSANSVPLGRRASSEEPTYQFNEDTLKADLKTELPTWILSSYGAAKYEPNLFAGMDMSQEEMRWKCVQAVKRGTPQEYFKEEADLLNQARKTIDQATSNLRKTRELAEKLHDARYPSGTKVGGNRPTEFSESTVLAKISGTPTGGFNPPTIPNAFNRPSTTAFGSSTPSAFGPTAPAAPKAFGTSGSTFGTSSFGQPAFGTSSSPSSAFVASPAPTTSAFGPSSGGSAFGTSAFGAKTTTSAFGSTTNSTQPSTSGFGSFNTSTTAFGAPQTTTMTPFSSNPSSNPTITSTAPAFGTSAFGKPANLSNNASPAFGSSGFGSSTPSAGSAFGQPAFGSSSSPASGGFGAFGKTTTTPTASAFSAFSSPSTSTATQPSSAFGTSAFGQVKQSAFGSTTSNATTATSAFTPNPFSATTTSAFSTPPSSNPFTKTTPNPFAPRTSSSTPAFSADVKIPPGWSYDDPWSWTLESLEIDEEGKGGEEDEMWKLPEWDSFDQIPVNPPPRGVRT
ncbi:hypothetical protein TREMEDRAFT_73071 [Tremella mesenterica DSM 1558]|uniref:uncharacterized protein n=1 Tax=Tremella mesenterica (strain ATCC 24925 / CBS 8224 / DSM 1558 / NBRC 9311 / NRRL Y-6157 / RJB 2259-6 / UBC 559-6) TaxID=578456 RepID=UPI0003F49D8E|nr:uncharacterized protein TREMEDRAFT_73071 [Tremella mesenterica DSM 1558]EIW73427.1 hypothetical protein TREMEDRAFT_73071 [Tremella mesenterica DSM 1558]